MTSKKSLILIGLLLGASLIAVTTVIAQQRRKPRPATPPSSPPSSLPPAQSKPQDKHSVGDRICIDGFWDDGSFCGIIEENTPERYKVQITTVYGGECKMLLVGRYECEGLSATSCSGDRRIRAKGYKEQGEAGVGDYVWIPKYCEECAARLREERRKAEEARRVEEAERDRLGAERRRSEEVERNKLEAERKRVEEEAARTFGAVGKTVSVAAVSDWTSTEIRVKRGQRIMIIAGGEVDLGNNQRSGPAGTPFNDQRKLIQTRPTGALIAAIGDDNDDFEFIGASAEFVAKHSGILFLGVNEGNLKDNKGSFIAQVKVLDNK